MGFSSVGIVWSSRNSACQLFKISLQAFRIRSRKSSLGSHLAFSKGPKYQYGTKYGFCSSNFPYGLGKYSPYGYLGPFGFFNPLEGDSCSVQYMNT